MITLNIGNVLFLMMIIKPVFAMDNIGEFKRPKCERFRVHLAAELPKVQESSDVNSTKTLPEPLKIAMGLWKDRIDFLKDPVEFDLWLKCVRQFVFIDTDKDGIPDWTAVVDGRPSRTLFPEDPDMDGDGIPNVLDPDPYLSNHTSEINQIPVHLKMFGEKAVWQQKLWQENGILAVDHSDEHIADTLSAAYMVLQLEPIRNWKNSIRGFNTIYAFGNRNKNSEIAAFHPTAHAISVPGKESLNVSQFTKHQKATFVSSMLHELGHVLSFSLLSASEFQQNAIQFGGWNLRGLMLFDLFSPGFLVSTSDGKTPFVSEYARANAHEWFAETFAAYIWNSQGLSDQFGNEFKKHCISTKLSNWFEELISRVKGNSVQKVLNTEFLTK